MNSAAKPYLVGLSGGSGSGKSTIARALIAELGTDTARLVGDDNYYWPRSHYGAEAWSAQEMEARINYDDHISKDMALFKVHVEALKSGKAIDQPRYSYSDHDRVPGEQIHITPHPIIIVEGIHAMTLPEIAALYDLTVFVSTPDDIRLARRITRDVNERGRDVNRVITQYLKYVRPTHYRCTEPAKYTADLVIADEGLPAYGDAEPSAEATNRMLAPILARLRSDGVVG